MPFILRCRLCHHRRLRRKFRLSRLLRRLMRGDVSFGGTAQQDGFVRRLLRGDVSCVPKMAF